MPAPIFILAYFLFFLFLLIMLAATAAAATTTAATIPMIFSLESMLFAPPFSLS